VKSIRVQTKKLQLLKKLSIFAKSAILAIFYFAPGVFQCGAKSIFIPKNVKLGKISTKKAFFYSKNVPMHSKVPK